MLMIWWVIWCLVFSSKILIGESVWRTLTRSLHLQMKQADLSHGKQMQKGTWPRKSRNLLWVLGWHVRPRQSFQKRSSSPSIPVLMPHLLWTWVSTSHAMWWLGRSSSQVPRRFSFPVCSQRRPNRFSCTLVEVGFQNQQRSLWFKQKFSVFHIKCFFGIQYIQGLFLWFICQQSRPKIFSAKLRMRQKQLSFVLSLRMHGSLTSIFKRRGPALNLLEVCEAFLFWCFKFNRFDITVVPCEAFLFWCFKFMGLILSLVPFIGPTDILGGAWRTNKQRAMWLDPHDPFPVGAYVGEKGYPWPDLDGSHSWQASFSQERRGTWSFRSCSSELLPVQAQCCDCQNSQVYQCGGLSRLQDAQGKQLLGVGVANLGAT